MAIVSSQSITLVVHVLAGWLTDDFSPRRHWPTASSFLALDYANKHVAIYSSLATR